MPVNFLYFACQITIADIWLTDIANKVKLSTLANYGMKLKKHILPYFAGIKYDKLTAENLNAFIICKSKENFSPKYIADIAVLIKSVARFAVRRYGFANPFESVALPKVQPVKSKLLTSSEQARLSKALTDSPSCTNVGILLSMTTGIRIGELCALRWENINLEEKFIAVRQTVQRISKNGGGTQLVAAPPKSNTSVREIPLPDFVIPYLKGVRSTDDCYLLSGGAKVVEPRTMQYRFKSLLKKAGLPYVNYHSLRHIFATNCISVGFDIKTLSEILGHSSVEITLERYVHSSMERKQHCMKLFSDSFSAA